MALSQNGWPVLSAGDPRLVTWTVPLKFNRVVKLPLRNGSAGFLLCLFVMWWDESVEMVFGKVNDDWGFAPRNIRGSSTEVSNHASATAVDINATKHPLGTRTLTPTQLRKIRWRLLAFQGCLRSGAMYKNRPDEMHVEVNKPLRSVERVARMMMRTKRGKALLAANPRQAAVIRR